jgi:ABC-2 type transport system ATP-binding protein
MNGVVERKVDGDMVQPKSDDAIRVRGLVKRFGKTAALDGLDARVARGSVYALLGRNGAGKSTLIQILTGMLDATEGDVRVLGIDPATDAVALKRLIGYIPDRLPMYEWMTVDEMLRFVASYYDNWSKSDEDGLVARFHLKRDRKVGDLSRGYRALLALVIAMAHGPEIVLLDECTSGMDAIARREFERSVIEALQAGGRSILFAGHQIDEMERICDCVGIMHDGKMLIEAPIDVLKSRVRLLRLLSEDEKPAIAGCEILSSRAAGRERIVTVRFARAPEGVPAMPPGTQLIEDVSLSLEEIFVALVGEE